jgi:hypothetical protein
MRSQCSGAVLCIRAAWQENGGSTVSPATAKDAILGRVPGERENILFLHAPLSHLIRGPVSGDLTIDKVQSRVCIVLRPANWNVLRCWLGAF